MARIRQRYPQEYGSSGNINTEFESLIRYINAAEFGNNTVGELLAKIFDANGVWDGPIEMRKDSSAGIQYRIGEYTDPEVGWVTLLTLADMRGEQGKDFGEIGAPIFHTRVDFVATASQTNFDYSHASTDTLLAYVNGVLKRPGSSYDYTTSDTANTYGQVIFNSGLSVNDKVTVFKVRATSITGYTRSDTVTTASQAVFAFVHTEETKLQVYKNGILQREGGSYDYTSSFTGNTVTFVSAVASGNLITILTVENTSVQAVTGMMFESNFVHSDSGLINFAKIRFDSNDIAQAKVSGLVTGLAEKPKLTVSATTPTTPGTGNLWHDTSQTPNQLKFYDGTQWIRTAPESSLPTFSSSDAGRFVKVNGTGTALEYSSIDLSSTIAVTQKGAANGVASLDSSGRMPASQLPLILSTDSFYDTVGTVANTTIVIKRVYKQKIRIDGISLQTTSGTCSIQIAVNGVGFGSTYSVSSTVNESTLGTPIEVDAITASKSVGYIVTNNSSGSALEVTMAISVVGS